MAPRCDSWLRFHLCRACESAVEDRWKRQLEEARLHFERGEMTDSHFTWDEYFIRIAHLVAQKSKDRSTKVGAVIVGPDREIRSTGFNGFPRGVNDYAEERHGRPAKYDWTVHAEANAIVNSARHGAATKDCTLYLNWEPYPCAECAKLISNSGIVLVVGPAIPFGGRPVANQIDWQEKFKVTRKMFAEVGVETRTVPYITSL